MKKLLYSASVVLLGAGLGIAQTTTNAQNTAPTETIDTRTPSALDPQTASPDSINLMNPVTGQNPDSHRSPNALPLSSSYDNAKHQTGSLNTTEPGSGATANPSSDEPASASNAQ